MSSEQQYIELYQQARQLIFDHAPAVMNAVRGEAFEHFVSAGFPSRKVERYKYTDIAKLFAPDYGLNLNRLEIPVDPYQAFRCDVPNLSTNLYFMVNDKPLLTSPIGEGKNDIRENVVSKAKLPDGVIIGNLSSPIGEVGRGLYAKLAKTADDAVTALNTMLAQDGLLVYVPKNVKVDRAIQVINILKTPSPNTQHPSPSLMTNRRVLIVLEEGAEIKMLFCDHAADDCHFLTTPVIEA